MPVKVVQIKGSNGSGKTTIAKQLIAQSKDIHLLKGSINSPYLRKKIVATTLNDLGWCVIGNYPPESKMGGCDGINTVKGVKAAINACLKYYPSYNVLFEGMMISTIKSTFYDYLLYLERTRRIQPVFVILAATPEVCVERLRSRGTIRPGLKVENIESKCSMVARHAASYESKYVRWMYVGNIDKSAMLSTFMAVL